MSKFIRALPLLLVASAAMAQDVGDETNSAANLNIPANVKLLGKVDPHLRKATAIVNGAVITGTDVDQRLALIVLANGGKIPDEERDRLRLQVLRNLIDEKLQVQEAKTHDITIERSEIDRSYGQVAQRFKQTPEGLAAYLRNAGSSDRSIKAQIEGELAWSRVLRRQVEPFVNVSGGEVQSVLDRLQASKGSKEYHVSELYLSATPETAAAVSDNARKIIEAVRGGGSFPAYARQFSQASTAFVGGDLGWVRAAQLPEALGQSLETMAIGEIAGPIAIPGGFSILVLQDSRQVLTADPRDAVLNLRQISIKFDAKTPEGEATGRASSLAKATQAMGGCGKAQEVAAQLGAELIDNDQVKIRDLPAPLQDTLLKMSVGEATPPFGSMTEGVRVLVLCGRDEAAAANGPSFDQIMSQMEEDRVNQRAQRYLRDLRRDAIVDYR